MTFPQYAKTTNPDVLATIRANLDGVADFHKRACAFAEAQGVELGAYFPSRFGGGHGIRAIGGDTRPTTGQWKPGHGGYGWLPYKSNPLHSELVSIRFYERRVPGLPSTVTGPANRDWSRPMASSKPFIVDEVEYVGFAFQPVDDGAKEPDPADGGWEEIKASELHLAMETYNERITSDGS